MFVQIIEGRTSNPEALAAAGEAWQAEVRPVAVGYLGVTAGVTADGKAFTLVRFEDEAKARANSELPEQGKWFQEHMSKCYDGEPSFTESSDITEFLGGGSNDAKFVQVMKSTGVDRAEIERLDKVFEDFVSERPDILGGVRAWTGPDSCIDVMYFTNEADARKGEAAEVPEGLQQAMQDFEGLGETEYLDLVDPHLA
jgi:hypothetical protein